jgi:hypothetical protein
VITSPQGYGPWKALPDYRERRNSGEEVRVVTIDRPVSTVPLLVPGLLESGRFRHREALFKHRLDARGQSLFEPGEQIVLTFDGVTRLPRWRIFGAVIAGEGISFSVVGLIFGLLERHRLRHDQRLVAALPIRDRVTLAPVHWFLLEMGLGFLVAGLVISATCWLRGSRGVMIALTTSGVVVCRTDWFGRPRAVVRRGPATEPVFHGGRRNCRRVVVGPADVYTGDATVLMLWRTMKPGAIREPDRSRSVIWRPGRRRKKWNHFP